MPDASDTDRRLAGGVGSLGSSFPEVNAISAGLESGVDEDVGFHGLLASGFDALYLAS